MTVAAVAPCVAVAAVCRALFREIRGSIYILDCVAKGGGGCGDGADGADGFREEDSGTGVWEEEVRKRRLKGHRGQESVINVFHFSFL